MRLNRPVDRMAAGKAHTQTTETDSVKRCSAAAREGDEAAQLFVASSAAYARGDIRGALQLLERAAGLGHTGAMLEAANLADELGEQPVRRHWLETAAVAGHAPAMFNLGVLAWESRDRATAAQWFESAATAGELRGFAALVELAEQAGDRVGAHRWAQQGADAGDPHCMGTYAMQLMDDGEHDFDVGMRWYERGAALGDPDCMVGAGLGWSYRGNTAQARHWFEQARAAGHPNARALLAKYCG